MNLETSALKIPVKIEPFNQWEIYFSWNDGTAYSLSSQELRFQCPCAGCVDEHTGQRILKRESIASDIKPTGMAVIGRYALQISWSDKHQTGMYHFDRVYELCRTLGKVLPT